MRQSVQNMSARKVSTILSALTVMTWAVLFAGAAPSSVRAQASRIQQTLSSGTTPTRDATISNNATRTLPAPVRFREDAGRGLLVRAWVNGAGPYVFAVDTGAGGTIISERVAAEAKVGFVSGRSVPISGLSGAGGGRGQEASVREIALG